jgi:hypothetical protein
MSGEKGKGLKAILLASATWLLTVQVDLRAQPPVISDVDATVVSGTEVTIAWDTDVDSTSRVDFGPTRVLGLYAEDATPTTTHSLTLTNLACDTYLFSVTSANQDGSTTDDNAASYYLFSLQCARLEAAAVWWSDTCALGLGGGDGVADPGETLSFTVRVLNPGGQDATNAQLAVSTTASGVTPSPALVSLGDVQAYDSTSFFQPEDAEFEVALDRGIDCGTEIPLTLTLSCDQGSWVTAYTFQVGATAPLLLEESFDLGNPPAGWSVQDGGDSGETWTTSNPGERYLPAGMDDPVALLDSDWFGEAGIQDDALVSPSLDCTAATRVDLSFRCFLWALQTVREEAALVEVSPDGGGHWATAAVWRINVGIPPAGEPPAPEGDPGASVPILLDISSIAAGESSVQVRFRYLGHYGYYWMVDDVRVAAWEENPACASTSCCDLPSGLSAPMVEDVGGTCSDSGVEISWLADPGTAWGDEGVSAPSRGYRVLRDGSDVSGFIAHGNTSWVDTAGSDNTSYTYRVRYENDCGVTADTEAVSGQDAYTPATPTISGGSTNVCPSLTVPLSTEAGMSSYQWRLDGSPVGTNSAEHTASASGTYTVSYTNGSGCSGTSAGHEVTIQACTVAPAPDGRGGTTPMRGVKSGSDVTVTFDAVTCPAPSYNLYYGPLSSASTYAWTDAVCGIDSGSTWTPPSGNTFWIIVGDSGPMESSWGLKRVGGVESQRSTTASGLCGNTLIDTTTTCP